MNGYFAKLSLRKKLIAAMLFTSCVSLFVAGGIILIYQLVDYRRIHLRELSIESEIVGANCSAAVAFADRVAAEEGLNSLQANPSIIYAVLRDTSGTAFAEYGHKPGDLKLPSTTESTVIKSGSDHVSVHRPIFLGPDHVGSIAVFSDLREEHARHFVSLGLIFAASMAAVALSIVLSLKFQGMIAGPLLSLAELAKRITDRNDYSLRAKQTSRDEMGTLVEGINRMLSEIERRDRELRNNEQLFRQLAESIKEVFWLTDIRKEKIIYISPGYEQIWGRSRATLYDHPKDWFEAIHPDDRSRVLAALTRQVDNNYDEEYRILLPDGSVKWIHDRAFAIADAAGEIYRVAGIAEDITGRKRLEKQLLEISDREQSRIGQDLHDGLCQYLVRIGFAANVLLQELEQTNHPEKTRAKKITELVDRSITQARNLARGLYPVKLETEGLQSGLEELAASIRAEHAIECDVDCGTNCQVQEYAVAIHLYRIAQEAVTNCVKHAVATTIRIVLVQAGDRLTLSVSDNGRGLGKSDWGMGLHIMNYRARILGANLEITPGADGGTIVSCTLQLPSDGKELWNEETPTHERTTR